MENTKKTTVVTTTTYYSHPKKKEYKKPVVHKTVKTYPTKKTKKRK